MDITEGEQNEFSGDSFDSLSGSESCKKKGATAEEVLETHGIRVSEDDLDILHNCGDDFELGVALFMLEAMVALALTTIQAISLLLIPLPNEDKNVTPSSKGKEPPSEFGKSASIIELISDDSNDTNELFKLDDNAKEEVDSAGTSDTKKLLKETDKALEDTMDYLCKTTKPLRVVPPQPEALPPPPQLQVVLYSSSSPSSDDGDHVDFTVAYRKKKLEEYSERASRDD